MLEICKLVESAINYCRQSELWGGSGVKKETMQTTIRNKLVGAGKGNSFEEWESLAKDIWGNNWFVAIYNKNLTADQMYNKMKTVIESRKEAENRAWIDEMVKELVESYKTMQGKGKVRVENKDTPKFLYTFELTIFAINTLYQLGVITGTEAKNYITNYVFEHPSLNSSKEAKQFKEYTPKELTYTITQSDGCCHSTTREYRYNCLWKIKN